MLHQPGENRGIKGGLGLAEDTSDAAISCQQVGPIELTDKIKTVKRRAMSCSRNAPRWYLKAAGGALYDAKRNALVYLTYSDKIVDGSPKNAISAVPIMPWNK